MRAWRAVVGAAALVAVVLPAPPARALPESAVVYPSASSATRVAGYAFDTCTAPSVAALSAWRASPYRTVNIYFGGNNRGCAQPQLTAAWVNTVSRSGWRLLPTYFGWQVSCAFGSKPHRYTAADATARGDADGADAVAQATALGLLPGSALYADVEHYSRTDDCTLGVRRYTSAWTQRLHAAGYLAGVYLHQDSGLPDLSATYGSSTYARPDAVWMARYDLNPALTGWPTAPDSQWAVHQRAKQYRGGHDETWGGVTLNVDSNRIDGPVATVAYSYRVTSTTSLNARTGPGSSYPTSGSYAPGSLLRVICQAAGSKVGTTSVWDRLTTGSWVTDRYVSTSSSTGYSSPLPRCTAPGQVTNRDGLIARTGPGGTYAATGPRLPYGGLAYVACQKAGTTVGTTRVWNRLDDGRWVSDYYVSNRSSRNWSAPVPRCP
jgi:Domain of unknown function (DUF1906)